MNLNVKDSKRSFSRVSNTFKSVVNIGKNKVKSTLSKEKTDKDFCYNSLTKVSRSFDLVIQQLPEELKDAIAVFYLVLRALDSIEDDMTVDGEFKNSTLKTFYSKCLNTSYCLVNIGENENEVELLEQYYKVARFMTTLKPEYQKAIQNITQLMGEGMADYAEMEIKTTADYDKYCHYVAGLVGIGLSDIFAASGLEDINLKDEKELSNSMGLFLQKTNITRDYQEDIYADRFFWPEQIWKNYAEEKDFFVKNPDNQISLDCLNDMVLNAMSHLPDAIEYMNKLQNEQVFRFCAIPQIMALATLSKLYNNADTFKGIVKIERSLTLEIFSAIKNMDDFKFYYDKFMKEMSSKNLSNSIHFETFNILNNSIKFN
jgi:farnesyl-diphosphate farnesyltransferase